MPKHCASLLLFLLGLFVVLPAAPVFAGDGDEPGPEALPQLESRYSPIPEINVNTQIISVVPSTTPLGSGVLQFRVTHRFSEPINHSTGHDLYGFDSGADIGLGIEYGFTQNLEAGFYRSSYVDDYVAHLKFRWIAQCDSFPFSISTRVGGNDLSDSSVKKDKSGAFAQVIFQRRFGPVELVVAPSYETNTTSFKRVTNVPVGFVWQLTESVNLNGEVVPKNRDNRQGVTGWTVSIEKRVPGHTFAFTLGNCRATTLDMALASDFPGGYKKDDIRVGFNITRRWRF